MDATTKGFCTLMLATLALVGCAHGTTTVVDEAPTTHVQAAAKPPTAYRVVVSADVANDPELAPHVFDAIGAWLAAVDGLTFTEQIGTCPPPGPATICIDVSDDVTGSLLGLTEYGAEDSSHVMLYEDFSRITLYRALMHAEPSQPLTWDQLAPTIAGHELGHALGIHTHLGPGCIMNGDPNTVAGTPSAGDVAAFWGVRQ